jgi:hypothetical protein
MATLQAATASSGARVTDPVAVEQLCEQYHFGALTWNLSDDDELSVCGYDAFRVYERCDNGGMDLNAGLVTHEFLHALAEYIDEEEQLDIQIAGFTKCRFPVLARRYVVRHSEVLHADLTGLEPISDEQPAP